MQDIMIHLQHFLLSSAQPQAPVIEGVLSPISSTTELPSKVGDNYMMKKEHYTSANGALGVIVDE